MKTIAIHLPQFHPVADNDAWWGRGFTEWTNVSRALPRFPGHHHPRVPADLGYVDMRVPEARLAQAELARRYGIDGFCYYHYWFEGRRLLERPVDEILALGEPDFPFSLCWANETWSRRWLGEEREVLLEQTYSMADHERHAQWLCRAFADRRYIRVGGRPLFLVYRPLHIPEVRAATDVYRRVALREIGCEPYLVGVDGHSVGTDFRSHGFDDTMNFRPQLGLLPGAFDDRFRIKRWLRNLRRGARSGKLTIADYAAFDALMARHAPAHGHYLPSVFVGWDNTPRRGDRGIVVVDGSPALFRRQVERAIERLQPRPAEQQLLFVNAWNEWAEGNHLEPDLVDGHAYLEALRDALRAAAPT